MNTIFESKKEIIKYLDSLNGKDASNGDFKSKLEFKRKIDETHSTEELRMMLIELKSEENAGKSAIKPAKFFMPVLLTFAATFIIVIIQFMLNALISYGFGYAQSFINYKIQHHDALNSHIINSIFSNSAKAIGNAFAGSFVIVYFFLGFIVLLLLLTFIINKSFYPKYKRQWFYYNLLVSLVEEKKQKTRQKLHPGSSMKRKR